VVQHRKIPPGPLLHTYLRGPAPSLPLCLIPPRGWEILPISSLYLSTLPLEERGAEKL
jgi:hypothetical protein